MLLSMVHIFSQSNVLLKFQTCSNSAHMLRSSCINNEWRAAQRVKYIKCAVVIKIIAQEPVASSVRHMSFSLKESVRA